MKSIVEQLRLRARWRWLRPRLKDARYRLGIGLLMFVWLGVYPLFLLILYSAKRGFLSFDLLTNGLIGLNSVLAWTGAFLLVLVVYQWGFVALWLLRLMHKAKLKEPPPKKGKAPWLFALLRNKTLWVLAAVMFVSTWAVFLLAAVDAQPASRWLFTYMSVFSLVLTVCLVGFVRNGWLQTALNWQGPLFFTLVSMFLPLLASDATADIMDVGLRQFRIGGGLHTTVELLGAEEGKTTHAQGRLLLLGEHTVYLETDEQPPTLIVVPNSQNLKIQISKTYGSNPR